MIVSDSGRSAVPASSEGASFFSPKAPAPAQKAFASWFATALSQSPASPKAPEGRDSETSSRAQTRPRKESASPLLSAAERPKDFGSREPAQDTQLQDSLSKMNLSVDGADEPVDSEENVEAAALAAEATESALDVSAQASEYTALKAGRLGDSSPSLLRQFFASATEVSETRESGEVGGDGEERVNLALGSGEHPDTFKDQVMRAPMERAQEGDDAAREGRGAIEREEASGVIDAISASSARSEKTGDDNACDNGASMIEQMMFALMMEGDPVGAGAAQLSVEDSAETRTASEMFDPLGNAASARQQPDVLTGGPGPASGVQAERAGQNETVESTDRARATGPDALNLATLKLDGASEARGRAAVPEEEGAFASRTDSPRSAAEVELSGAQSSALTVPHHLAPTSFERAVEASLSPRVMAVDDLHEGLAQVVAQGTDHIQLRVAPPGLGALNIDVRLENGTVRLHVVGSAPELETHLSANLQGLRHELETRGLSLGDMTFSSGEGSDSSEQPRFYGEQSDDRPRERAFVVGKLPNQQASARVPNTSARPRTQRIEVII